MANRWGDNGNSDSLFSWAPESLWMVTAAMKFNLYAEYIMRNARLDEAQMESRFPGEISITSDMQMTPPLWKKVKRN